MAKPFRNWEIRTQHLAAAKSVEFVETPSNPHPSNPTTTLPYSQDSEKYSMGNGKKKKYI